MTVPEAIRRALAQAMTALVMLSTVILAGPARAGDGPSPVVLASKAALPTGCVSLGEVSAEVMNATPRASLAEDNAVLEAKQKGATHVVTVSSELCGAYSYCYTGIAYRCPAPSTPASR